MMRFLYYPGERKYPEIGWELNVILCNRVRLLYGYVEDASTLSLHQRLARTMLRLAYSHGIKDADCAPQQGAPEL